MTTNKFDCFPGKAAGVTIASEAAAALAVEAAKFRSCLFTKTYVLKSEWDQPAVSVHVKVSCSSGFLDMFKYAISTKMEVLNLSLGGPNYSALPFVKDYYLKNMERIILLSLFTSNCFVKMDIGDIPNTGAAVVLPNEVK
ncbi:hypothetical protein MKW98_025199 [Papaver atlanticum]|uniref:Uncharacterized protein n=1 Tax=Papaver atlanticum TaxID=357466 RepID=A0AAD4S2R0_9MAGN|nr:hypothetical protein MKW98_025199 [Papaver atlanticum]